MGILGSIVGTVLGGLNVGGAIVGAKAQRKAAKKAAAAVTTQANASNALATAQYSPYTTAGAGAMGQANALLGLGTPEQQTNAFDTYRNSTGYQFRLGEGMNALNSGYAGAGVLQSGAALRGAQEYGQDFASNEFNNYFNQVRGQAQMGLGATAGLVGTVSQNNAMIGDAQANAALIRGQNNPFAAGMGAISGSLLSMGTGGLKF